MGQILRPGGALTVGKSGPRIRGVSRTSPVMLRFRAHRRACQLPTATIHFRGAGNWNLVVEVETVSRLEQFLASVPVLASLKPEQLAMLAARTTVREYQAGDVILRTGERNRTLYLLKSGRLAVQVSRGDLRETVAYLHPGAPFGELSLITG